MKPMTWLAFVVAAAASVQAADWNQWRGPNRDGVADSSPKLIDRLPDDGLAAVWSVGGLEGGGTGGWSSPVVAEGRVYLFVPARVNRPGVKLEAEKYPSLNEAQRGELDKDELAEYDANRNHEQQERRDRQFEFRDVVHCFDAESGKLLWKHERASAATDFGHSGTPAVLNGRLYYLGSDRRIACVDAAEGTLQWAAPLHIEQSSQSLSSSVAIADGAVVALAGDLVAGDATSGEFLWKSEHGRMGGIESSPAVWKSGSRELIVANVSGGETVCVEPRTGTELWRVESMANRSTPVIAPGHKLITLGESRKGGLRCYELAEDAPKLLWTFQGLSDPGASPVVVDGYVYAQGEQRLACVNLETGEPAWRGTLDIPQPRYTSLAAADGKVFYAFDGVYAFAAKPEELTVLFDGKMDKSGRLATAAYIEKALKLDEVRQSKGQQEADQLWQREIRSRGPLQCASPAIADGRLYIRLNGGLVCYDLRMAR